MKDAIMAVDFRHRYESLGDGVTQTSNVCISLEAIQNGLIKDVGAKRFSVLLAILSHMNTEGKAFPSQKRISELTGQSKNTVMTAISELLEIEIDGQPLLLREKTGTGVRQRSTYFLSRALLTNSVMDDVETDVIDEVEKQLPASEDKDMTAGDFVKFFCEQYKETFDIDYPVNFSRDTGIFKNKLMKGIPDQDKLKAVIKFAVTEYPARWAKPEYPAPTVPMLSSWLGNAAYLLIKDSLNQVEVQAEREITAAAQDDTDRAFSLFD